VTIRPVIAATAATALPETTAAPVTINTADTVVIDQPVTTTPPEPTDPDPTTTDPPRALVGLPPEYEAEIEQCDSWDEEWLWNGNLAPCTFGPRIAEVQRALIAWGVGDGVEADGYFGPATQRALLTWQWRHGWPDRTTWLEKRDGLWPQVTASLSNPDLPRDTPCLVWLPVDREAFEERLQFLKPGDPEPVLDLCDEDGVSIWGIQTVLTELGYPTSATGRFDVETRGSLLRYTADVFGEPQGYLDFDLFWHLLGD